MSKHSTDQVKYVADSIMPGFIPKNAAVADLSFSFTLDGINYEVIYKKDPKGIWQYQSHREA